MIKIDYFQIKTDSTISIDNNETNVHIIVNMEN
jgi:hypothetical protein